MTRGILWSIIGGTLLSISAAPSAAVTVGVDPSAAWLGFMNVSEIPANGGGYVFGSPWGPADLVATFSGPVLTLAPNSVNDASAFWYTPAGGPGSTGNKIMDANMYIEPAGSLPGQTVTFTGNVLANTLTDDMDANGNGWTSVAFIKDFAPDYSSFVGTSVELTPGEFSISFETIDDPARHVQYGFQTIGPNVWITDVGNFGSIQITAASSAGVPGDYNENSVVDAADYTEWRDNLGAAISLPNEGVTTGTVTQEDYDFWKSNFGNSGSGGSGLGASTVPEPGSWVMCMAAAVMFMGCWRRIA